MGDCGKTHIQAQKANAKQSYHFNTSKRRFVFSILAAVAHDLAHRIGLRNPLAPFAPTSFQRS